MGKIVWTERASTNLCEIFDYVQKSSKVYADRLVKSIVDATTRLERMPQSGRIVPELNMPDLREIIHHNYRIVYRVQNGKESVEIIAIIHGARDFKNALGDLQ